MVLRASKVIGFLLLTYALLISGVVVGDEAPKQNLVVESKDEIGTIQIDNVENKDTDTAPKKAEEKVHGKTEAVQVELSEKAATSSSSDNDKKVRSSKSVASQASYTVYDAIMAARERNMQLKAGKEAQLAINTDKYTAMTEFAPTVYISNNWQRNNPRSSLIKSDPSLYDRNTRSTSLVINQPIFSGGSTVSNIKRTKHLAKAAKLGFTELQHEVILSAITAYEALRTVRSVYEMNIKNEKSLQDYLELTETKFKYGAVTRTDLKQVESRLASATAGRIKAHSNVIAGEAQFAHIIGYPPPVEMEPVASAKIPVPNSLDEMLAVMMDKNPELHAAKHSFKAAARGVDGAIAKVAPTVSLQAQRTQTDVSKISLNKPDGDTVMLGVSIPIFQSGAEYTSIKKSRHTREQARYNMEETRLRLREAAISTWEGYASARSVIDATQKAVVAAEQAYEFVIEEAKSGARTSLDVLDAELEMFSARVQHRQAEAEAIVAVFTLHKVMGDLLSVVTDEQVVEG